jgi:hypothetical protein
MEFHYTTPLNHVLNRTVLGKVSFDTRYYNKYTSEYCSTFSKDVLNQAMQRGACDCAICMIPMTMTMTLNLHDVESHHSTLMQQHNQKKSVLLSCTHLFHESCLSSFEKFSRNEVCDISSSNLSMYRFHLKLL